MLTLVTCFELLIFTFLYRIEVDILKSTSVSATIPSIIGPKEQTN